MNKRQWKKIGRWRNFNFIFYADNNYSNFDAWIEENIFNFKESSYCEFTDKLNKKTRYK